MTVTAEPRLASHPKLDSRSPEGPAAEMWETFKQNVKLVNPNNKRKFKVIVVGTGLAGASAAATLAELGYQVDAFTFHDSPRRAHSIAAQGGINAAKNYRGDGDSIHRLFYDTIKGGDFRARESNVYRLAQVSVDIIDQMVAQGVPFAHGEYGGLLDNRSFGGAQVSRTFYARRADGAAAAARRVPATRAAGRARHGAAVQPHGARRHGHRRRRVRRHRGARSAHRRDQKYYIQNILFLFLNYYLLLYFLFHLIDQIVRYLLNLINYLYHHCY